MESQGVTPSPVVPLAVMVRDSAPVVPDWIVRHAPVLAGALVCALPASIEVGRTVWTTEQGAHGPIILVTGLWLLCRETRADAWGRRGPRGMVLLLGLLAIAAAGMVAVFSAIIGKVWLQAAATYGVLVVVYGLIAGPRNVRAAWFALVYLAFLIPPPPGIIVPLTRSLKLGIAQSAADALAALGYSTTSLGASLYIDSYELVVAAACAGLNSLTSLLAVGLLYAFLRHRAQPAFLAVLAVLALPVAILANFLRVVLLLLVTHYLGNAAAQGMLHDAAGLTTFSLALATMVLIDLALVALAQRFGPLRARRAADAVAPGPVPSAALLQEGRA
jgi:exosortase